MLDEGKNVCSFTSNAKEVEIDYCNDLSDRETEKYINYLIEKEGFVQIEEEYGKTLEKIANGYIYRISVNPFDKIVFTATKINSYEGRESV